MNAVVLTAPDTFDFEGHPIRVFRDGKNVTFAAIDLAKCAGYGAVGDMTRLLQSRHKGEQIVRTPGGRHRIVTVTEAGLYRILTQRRGSDRTPPEIMERIERFQDWVFEDVLPSIRRTRSYTLPAAQPQPVSLLDALRDPEQVIALLAHHAQATLAARAELSAERKAHSDTFQQLEEVSRIADHQRARADSTGRELVVAREVLAEQAPVAEAFRRFRDTGKAENLRTVARILSVENHTDFFKWRRERGWFFDEGGWIQAKASMLRGRLPLCIIQQVTCSDGKERWQTLVTPRGQIWLHDRWQARKRILAAAAAGAAPPVDPTLFDDED